MSTSKSLLTGSSKAPATSSMEHQPLLSSATSVAASSKSTTTTTTTNASLISKTRKEVVIPIEGIPEIAEDETPIDLKALYIGFFKSHLPLLSVLISGIILAYLIGLYKWSMLWLPLLIYIAWFIGKRRVEQFEAYHVNRVDRVLAKQRLPMAPETCEWINHIVERFWGVFEPVMSAQVIDKVNDILKHSKPGFLDNIELSEFTLGSAAPAILGAQVYPNVTDADNIHLDLEVSFVPNEHTLPEQYCPPNKRGFIWNNKIVLTARLGRGIVGVDIPILLSGIMFHGTARVHLMLAPNVPFVKKVQICFLRDPDLDFVLKPLKAFDLMDTPGLSNWLHGTIRNAIRSQLVHPNKIIIDVSEIVATKKKSDEEGRAVGIARVTVFQCRGLPNPQNTSVRLSIAGKFKGTTDRLKEAAWNEVFYVLINTKSYPLTFNLQGPASTLMSASSESFGSCKVSLDDPGDLKNKGWRQLTLRSAKSKQGKGELKVSVDHFPTLGSLDEAIAGTMAGGDKTPAKANLDDMIKKSTTGVLHVVVHGAKELSSSSKASKKEGHVWSTFVELHVDNALSGEADRKKLDSEYDFFRKRTVTKKKTNTPTWEQNFEFVIGDVHKDRFYLRVRDDKEDIDLGHLDSPIIDLLKTGTAWFNLQGVEGGRVYLTFLFNPVVIPGGIIPAGQTLYLPTQAVARVNIRKLCHTTGTSALQSIMRDKDHYVQLLLNDALVGETRHAAGQEINYQECFDILLKSPEEDDLTLAVMVVDVVGKDECIGRVSKLKLPAANQTIHKEEQLKDRKLIYDVTYYPVKGTFDRNAKFAGNVAIVPEPSPTSNCGLLFLDALVLEGLAKSGIVSSEHKKLRLYPEVFITPETTISLPAIVSREGSFKWTDGLELFIQDYQKDQLHVIIYEHNEELISLGSGVSIVASLKVPVKALKRRAWYPLYEFDTGKVHEKGHIYFEGFFRNIDAKVPPRPINPSGTLSVNIRSATNLLAVDSGGTSDPYVHLELNGKKLDKKTKVIKKNAKAPVWNEKFEVLIEDQPTSQLELHIWDWNALQTNKSLGYAKIDLVDLNPTNNHTLDFPAFKLIGVDQGTLSFSIKYEPKSRDAETMAQLFDKVGPAIVKKELDILGAGGKVIGGTGKVIGGAVGMTGKAVGTTGKAIGGAVGTTGKALGGAVGTTGKALGGAVGTTGKALGGAVGTTGKALEGAVGSTGKAFTSTGKAIGGAVGGVFHHPKKPTLDEYNFGLKVQLRNITVNPALLSVVKTFNLQLQAFLDEQLVFASKAADQAHLNDLGPAFDIKSCKGHRSIDLPITKTSLTPEQLKLPSGTKPMWHLDLSTLVQDQHDLTLPLNGIPEDDAPLLLKLTVQKIPLTNIGESSQQQQQQQQPSSHKLFPFGSKK